MPSLQSASATAHSTFIIPKKKKKKVIVIRQDDSIGTVGWLDDAGKQIGEVMKQHGF